MANIQYLITLTSEGPSSGPNYIVTYSTGSTYYPVVAGSPAYLPEVGSSAVITITSGSYTTLRFKLNNGTGGECEICNNDVVFTVIAPPTPTPTASPTPTPTATPTASPTPTPTASPTPTPTASPTPTPTPSPTPAEFYYYSVNQFDCDGCIQTFSALVARSSIARSTTNGFYYNPYGDGFVYQIQTEITPAPFTYDIDISSAPSNADCGLACII
jgi:hypothetical protein